MILNKKFKNFIILIAVANILTLFAILFLFNSINKDTQLLTTQKKELFQIEKRAENSKKLEKIYQDNNLELEKINNLFAKKSTPIEFIEFLEQTAKSCSLSVEISYLSFNEYHNPKKDEIAELYPWDFFNLKLNTKGDFNNSFAFLRKVENSPYLIEVENLNIKKKKQEDKDVDKELFEFISTDLSLKIYAK